MARNLKTACLWSLNLDLHNAQQCILNVPSKSRLKLFPSFRKNKETKCIFMQFSKKIKVTAFSLSKMCRSIIFAT